MTDHEAAAMSLVEIKTQTMCNVTGYPIPTTLCWRADQPDSVEFVFVEGNAQYEKRWRMPREFLEKALVNGRAGVEGASEILLEVQGDDLQITMHGNLLDGELVYWIGRIDIDDVDRFVGTLIKHVGKVDYSEEVDKFLASLND